MAGVMSFNLPVMAQNDNTQVVSETAEENQTSSSESTDSLASADSDSTGDNDSVNLRSSSPDVDGVSDSPYTSSNLRTDGQPNCSGSDCLQQSSPDGKPGRGLPSIDNGSDENTDAADADIEPESEDESESEEATRDTLEERKETKATKKPWYHISMADIVAQLTFIAVVTLIGYFIFLRARK